MSDAARAISEVEAHFDERRYEAGLRGLMALAGGPGDGERARRLRHGAIELLAQLVDLKEDRRARRLSDGGAAQAERTIAAEAMGLVDDAKELAARDAFASGAIAAARASMRTYAMRAAEEAAKAKGAIFISYRRSDCADAAGRIYEDLAKAFGPERVFMDVESIPLGIDFRVHIVNILSQCRACLVLIGDEWVTCRDEQGRRRLDHEEDLVRVEIETALRVGVAAIPITIGQACMPKMEELPQSIAALHYLNGQPVRPNPDYHGDVSRLVGRLSALLA